MGKVRFVIFLLLMFAVSACLASEEVGSSEENGASIFSGYFGESVWTLILFAALLIVLWKFAWTPLMNGLNAREDHIANQISSADKTRKEAEEKLAKYQAKLDEADIEGKSLAHKHITEAQTKAQELLEKARLEVQEIKSRNRDEIERAKENARRSLITETGEMVFGLGSEILGRSLSASDNEKMIDEAIEIYKQQRKQKV